MVSRLERWVNLNTGTSHLTGLKRFAEWISADLRKLGFKTERLEGIAAEVPGQPETAVGPVIIARRKAKTSRPHPVHFLLAGHYDTVFKPDSPFQKFRTLKGSEEQAQGPGIADMKGGLVILLEALRALWKADRLDDAQWTVLLNADEEIGSPGSRPWIEKAAREATYGFVFEMAQAGGAMVRSRRGIGQFHLRVTGVAAHAGGDHPAGKSAVRELAEKIIRLEALTDYEGGVTVNVGVARGGTQRNVIPAHAEAWIDVRYDDMEKGEALEQRMQRLAQETFVPGTRTRLRGQLHRPPKPSTEATLRLLAMHREAAQAVGIELPPAVHVGGGTDGSLMGAVGLPTLDSMGAAGGKAHTEQEFADLRSLPERAAVAAILLRRLMDQEEPAPF